MRTSLHHDLTAKQMADRLSCCDDIATRYAAADMLENQAAEIARLRARERLFATVMDEQQ